MVKTIGLIEMSNRFHTEDLVCLIQMCARYFLKFIQVLVSQAIRNFGASSNTVAVWLS